MPGYQCNEEIMALYPSWAHKRTLPLNTTVSGAAVATPQSHFPTLIRITATEMDFSQADTNGQDIRFTNDAEDTDLDFEIERWDNAGSLGEIHVRVPSVVGNSTTNIKMFWGKSGQTTDSNPNNTFRTADNFFGVYHLKESASGTGTANVYKDSTANGNDGDDEVSATGKGGIIGKGQDFDGTADHIQLGTGDPSAADFTLSTWINWDGDTSANQYILSKRDTFSASDMRWSWYRKDSASQIWFERAGIGAAIFTTDIPSTGTWIHLALVYTIGDTTAKLYIDGVQTGGDKSFTVGTDATSALIIGAANTSGAAGFDGRMDEVRFEDAARSADWLKLIFESQKASQTLVTFGAVINNIKAERSYPRGINRGITRGVI